MGVSSFSGERQGPAKRAFSLSEGDSLVVNIASDVELGGASSRSRSVPMGYALWQYTESGWSLRKDASVDGAIPGEAPRTAGQFVGQLRAMPSVIAVQK